MDNHNAQADANSLLVSLSQTACFEGLEPALLAELGRCVESYHYDEGQVVLLEGEPCAGLGIVRSGCLKAVRLSMSGREQTLSVLWPGEIYSAASVFADAPNPVTIVALQPTDIWVIPKESLDSLQERYPRLTQIVARNLARRVMTLIDLVEDLSLRTVEMRLAHQLLANARDNIVQREAWATQAEMSARLGTVTYVLNRALRSLEEEGLIRVERDEITIIDAEGLAARAEAR